MMIPKKLDTMFARLVRLIEEHPTEAGLPLRAVSRRIDALIEECDCQEELDLYNALWGLMIELKDHAALKEHAAHRAA
jgi:hypothetical protein